jgi:hypothetical protein
MMQLNLPTPDIVVSDTGTAWGAEANPELINDGIHRSYWNEDQVRALAYEVARLTVALASKQDALYQQTNEIQEQRALVGRLENECVRLCDRLDELVGDNTKAWEVNGRLRVLLREARDDFENIASDEVGVNICKRVAAKAVARIDAELGEKP